MGFSRLNQLYCKMSKDIEREKYRVLFGSDLIVP
jgi:hypothetical protein